MKQVDWSKTLIRCSGIGKIMSESRDNPPITPLQLQKLLELEEKTIRTAKQSEELAGLLQKQINSQKVTLSDTCTTYLLEVYAWEKYGKESISGQEKGEAVQKGNEVEPDSITLLSLIDKTMYYKNEERVTNDFLTGMPDIGNNRNIWEATKITDIKSSFDIITFLASIRKPINPTYVKQLNGYGAILKIGDLEIAYCLVDSPAGMINDRMRRLLYKMDVATEDNPDYLKAAAKMKNNMIFHDIPQEQRVFKQQVPIIDMNPIYERVHHCRKWLKEFEEIHENMNK